MKNYGCKKSKCYFDKHGEEIFVGNKIRHDNGEVEVIYEGAEGRLGINASRHSKGSSVYPLEEFNLDEWELTD